MLFNEPKLLKCPLLLPLVATICPVSVLFNEPKLLKSVDEYHRMRDSSGFSALQRAEIAEIPTPTPTFTPDAGVSVLFNEPKLLKCDDLF